MEQYTDELYHYGRLGMKWGQHIFGKQPTSVGRKRSSGASSDSERRTKSNSAASFRSRVEAGRRALGESRQQKADEKTKQKAADEAKRKAEAEAKAKADREAKRQEVLNSKSAKLLSENSHLFTDQELQTAYNRLVLERNISSLVPKEVSKGEAFVNGTIKWGGKAADLASTGIRMYENVNKIRKLLDGDKDDKEFDMELTYKNRNKLSDEALKKAADRATNYAKLRTGAEKEKESKAQEAAEKAAKSAKEAADAAAKAQEKADAKAAKQAQKKAAKESESWSGTVEGEGTSHFSWDNSKTTSKGHSYTSEIIGDAKWADVTTSNLPAVVSSSTRSYVTALLEELE